jgi:hypothetical protein
LWFETHEKSQSPIVYGIFIQIFYLNIKIFTLYSIWYCMYVTIFISFIYFLHFKNTYHKVKTKDLNLLQLKKNRTVHIVTTLQQQICFRKQKTSYLTLIDILSNINILLCKHYFSYFIGSTKVEYICIRTITYPVVSK